ncbi:protocatechuate 3,4-dioxygenase alpha subunit [Nitrospirillum amazonense]|uniref:Protocatechuate 3,4-dioxygenase alpha subunit n=1 Tax=Nitrospirillum amazonense TaxID=28077 RepID=A0A560F120_9PROT|nr:protocatechuate 3,4-dioxygenase subunit alpha [Nitrospirillum amazonense]TWB15330.1 protocatechuate 3,4-dioxygenase alpha subunit [Nitrospirillum amazonense]
MPVPYLKETPSQTGGPYVHIGCLPHFAGLNLRTQEKLHVLAGGGVPGERIRIEGVVWDGSGHPLRDVMLELWQADSTGTYNAPGFRGWGRVGADPQTGLWGFETVRPGATPWIDGRPQAPHCSLLLFARGINIHLHTRIYFDDRPEANAADPALLSIELVNRRQTLIATRQAGGQGGSEVPTFRFDVHLQGEKETVFFDC